MKAQRRVAAFVSAHGLDAPPAYRLLDLVSEIGELSKDAVVSTGYGKSADEFDLSEAEVGDVLFSLLALADGLDVDAGDALDRAIEKYERRVDERGSPASER